MDIKSKIKKLIDRIKSRLARDKTKLAPLEHQLGVSKKAKVKKILKKILEIIATAIVGAIIGLIFSIIFIYFFTKALAKEAKCKA